MAFLKALATALEFAVNNGLDIGRRLGWGGDWRLRWRRGRLNRVYYVQVGKRVGETSEPDEPPPGSLLRSSFLTRWSHASLRLRARQLCSSCGSGVSLVPRFFIRLCTSAARNPQLASPQEIGEFLFALDDRHFWDLHVFPKVAELRAARFGDLDLGVQKVIAKRLRKGPPRDHWPKKAGSGKSQERSSLLGRS